MNNPLNNSACTAKGGSGCNTVYHQNQRHIIRACRCHERNSAGVMRGRRVVASVKTRFGTDGIRGRIPEELCAEQTLRIGAAIAEQFGGKKGGRCRVVLGHDPRSSSGMLEAAVTAGLCAAGAEVERVGVMPTPGVAWLTRQHEADGGIVISASHNTAEYNGIKCFDAQGYKLSDVQERELEERIERGPQMMQVGHVRIPHQDPVREYTDYLAGCAHSELSGLRVVFDGANGAASATIPRLIRCLDLHADVIGCYPNGENINRLCGSTDLTQLQELMASHSYDVGFAFDGDADRCIAVDERGAVLDGDVLLGALAQQWKREHPEQRAHVTTTVLSNAGLRRFLREQSMDITYTAVGDRQVMKAMRENQGRVGGEPSGHFILREYSTTGDGQLTAIRLMEWLVTSGMRASDLQSQWKPVPQAARTVTVPAGKGAEIATSEDVEQAVAAWQERLGEGRILVRPSGTEAVIRVMAECPDVALAEQAAEHICRVICHK